MPQTIARKGPLLTEPASDFESDEPESGEDSSETSRSRARLSKKQDRRPRRAIEDIKAHISPTSTSRLSRRPQQEQAKGKNMATVPSLRKSNTSNKRRNSDGDRLIQAATKNRRVDSNRVGLPGTSTAAIAPAGVNMLTTRTGSLPWDTFGATARPNVADDGGAPSESQADEDALNEPLVDKEALNESRTDQRDDSVSVYDGNRNYEARRRLRVSSIREFEITS